MPARLKAPDAAPAHVRLPIAPLITQLKLDAAGRGRTWSAIAMCRDLGICERTWTRWAAAKTISVEGADLIACRYLNMPPVLIWPEWGTLPFKLTPKQRRARELARRKEDRRGR